MCKKVLKLSFLVVSIGVGGCATPADRAIGMAETAPKTTRLSDQGYYASCGYEGGHPVPWAGPLRSSAADALRDARDHNQAYPGHQASLIH